MRILHGQIEIRATVVRVNARRSRACSHVDSNTGPILGGTGLMSPRKSLFTYTKPFDNGPISRNILVLEVIQKAAPFPDHSQKTSARMVILGMRFEMLRQVSDFFAQNGNLHFWRPGIRCVC